MTHSLLHGKSGMNNKQTGDDMNIKEIETTVYEIARIILARSHHNRCREEILEELDITDANADILQQVVEEHQRGGGCDA